MVETMKKVRELTLKLRWTEIEEHHANIATIVSIDHTSYRENIGVKEEYGREEEYES